MNKTLQSLFLFLFPFYPLLAWAFHFVTIKPLALFLNLMLMPLALYFLTNSRMRLPKYLLFLIIFALYHLASCFIFNTIPPGTNKIFFVLADHHLFACVLCIIIENTRFEDRFISKMTRNIFWIVILSMLVSVIQIQDPNFFYNEAAVNPEAIGMDSEIRNASIYSWYTINSGGISFPIMIAILLNYYDTKKGAFLIIILAGITVSFLAKARYMMISTLIAFSQMFFSRMKSMSKIVSLTVLITGGVLLLIFIAGQAGYDIQEVISSRILEEDSEMESAKARVKSYEVFMIKFPESPWFGVGPETRADVLDLLGGGIPIIHVGYLSYLYFYGIAGCIFLFLALYYLMMDAWYVGKRFNFWGSFYGLVTFCFANMTFVYFNFAEIGIVLAIIFIRYYKSTYAEALEEEDTPVIAAA